MKRLKILVFDDDLVRHPGFLGDLPADFVYRANADACLADVDEVQPDAVFMDFSMGSRISGADAVQTLRKRHDFDALPIIGISSDADCNRSMCHVGATWAVVKMALPERFNDILAILR